MVDSPGHHQTSDLKDSSKATLQALFDLGGQAVGLDNIAEQREVTKQALTDPIQELKEEGLITVDQSSKPYIYKLTGDGYREVDSTPYGTGQVDSSSSRESGKSNRRLHALTVIAKVVGGDVVPEKWMGRMREEERVNFTKRQGENNSAVWTNRFFIRLHKDSATIQLREGVNYDADSDVEAFLEFHSDLQELLQWIQRATGVEMKEDLVDLRRCELAFEDHHLAVLVKKIPHLDLSDFKVEDEEIGREVAKLDDSFGPELETMSPEQAEAVGHVVNDEMEQYALRPTAVRKRHRFENEMDLQEVNPQEAVHTIRQASGMQEQLQSTEAEVEEVSEEVEVMREKQEQLLELKSKERDTRDALIELVRSNQNVIHELKEELQESGQREYDSPVQEIFMETWEDPDYSRPWFQDGYLKAWNISGDGEPECEIILRPETVERLK